MIGLSTENRLRSQQTQTRYTIKVNNCKLIDLVIRIELTRAILAPLFSNLLRNSTIHFWMFLYLENCFLRVRVSLLCRLEAVSKIQIEIYPDRISEGNQIVRPCDRHSNETVTLMKHVTNFKDMRKFIRKFENRGIKIARVN